MGGHDGGGVIEGNQWGRVQEHEIACHSLNGLVPVHKDALDGLRLNAVSLHWLGKQRREYAHYECQFWRRRFNPKLMFQIQSPEPDGAILAALKERETTELLKVHFRFRTLGSFSETKRKKSARE